MRRTVSRVGCSLAIAAALLAAVGGAGSAWAQHASPTPRRNAANPGATTRPAARPAPPAPSNTRNTPAGRSTTAARSTPPRSTPAPTARATSNTTSRVPTLEVGSATPSRPPSAAITPVRTNTATRSPAPAAAAPSAPTTRPHATPSHTRAADRTPPGRGSAHAATPPVYRNPLLPPQVAIDGFYVDLSTLQKLPTITPSGFDPLYTDKDWVAYRTLFGAEADAIGRLKSSGILALSEKMIAAATGPELSSKDWTPGLQRLLLLRAAALCYRNRDGFPTANKAVTAYQLAMDKKSPAQVGALWSITNAMSRMAVTPKPERIRYDGIAARANMQLALLMLEADQVEAAAAIIRQIGYHEGWLKSDPDTRAQIAQVRARVNAAVTMMDFLATQYDPAVRNDESALMTVYLYGRYVKGREELVADLPSRVPNSRLAQLAASIQAAKDNPSACFAAAENLRVVASTLPEVPGTVMIRQRTLYAALQHYRAFLNSPHTERDRINRTLARMSLEAVISDGAHSGTSLDPFAPHAPNTANSAPLPATRPAPSGATPPATQPAEPPAVG